MSLNINRLEADFYKKADIALRKKAEQYIAQDRLKLIKVYPDRYGDNIIQLYGQYTERNYYCTATIDIDINNSKIIKNNCECTGWVYRRNNMCVHTAAITMCYIEGIRENERLQRERYNNMGINCIKELQDADMPKSRLKLDINIDKYYDSSPFIVTFKMGCEKMYVLKNIEELIRAKYNEEELVFGKNFTYVPLKQEFDESDEQILDYLEEAAALNNTIKYGTYQLLKGKELRLSEVSLRRFLEYAVGRTVVFNDNRYEVINNDIPISFKLNKESDMYTLKLLKKSLCSLTSKNDVYIFEGKIYLPSKKQIKKLSTYLKYISEYGEIQFKPENEIEMFNNVIGKLTSYGTEVQIDKKITNLVKQELNAEFFLDYSKKKMILDVNLKYGDEVLKFYNQSDKTEKIVIRDNLKEQQILDTINQLNFSYDKDKFKFDGSEEEFYDFLVENYKKLEGLGEVYYSDRLKQNKVYMTPNITAGINTSDNDYLEFSFNIEDIKPAEYKNILEAFREKRKYYRLKDNSFLNLQDNKLNDFLGLIDSVDANNKSGTINITRNKAVVISDYLNEKKMNFIKGKEIIDDISEKLLNLKNMKFKVPKSLNAELRKYQVTGYKWFKNLSYLGFGGILADEMGLGKTVQTIAFLLSEENKKSLIVAPTSLIYNWKNEFLKFAPSMKVCVLHGNKDERMALLNEAHNYDVVLTTYGTLKNDEEKYNEISFDYCILDEGQNIKNPLAQNTQSVKSIKAKNRFVLTGTPIENNLIELWSIFDFIMPDYLDNVNNFKRKFINRTDSAIELQKYIKPFMLRRLKKDVLNELPEKIEKNYYVELSVQQKKLYAAYVKDIKDKMDDPEFKDDKITIFSYLTKLRQLCLDPSVILENYKGKNSKCEELISILKDNIQENHKILVFSQFTSVLKNISERMTKEKIEHFYLDGGTNASKRLDLVDEFNKSDKTKVFLISLKAGGTGLNLTSADIVVHFDPWWNPAVEEQATDRAHRIGQKNVVQVIKLISEGTIEEKIINMQEEKKKLINDVLDNNYTSENILKSLSNEELKELFR